METVRFRRRQCKSGWEEGKAAAWLWRFLVCPPDDAFAIHPISFLKIGGEHALVKAEELEFSIQGTRILRPLTFSIEPGRFAAFIAIRCGKTTLLNLIAGIQKGYTAA